MEALRLHLFNQKAMGQKDNIGYFGCFTRRQVGASSGSCAFGCGLLEIQTPCEDFRRQKGYFCTVTSCAGSGFAKLVQILNVIEGTGSTNGTTSLNSLNGAREMRVKTAPGTVSSANKVGVVTSKITVKCTSSVAILVDHRVHTIKSATGQNCRFAAPRDEIVLHLLQLQVCARCVRHLTALELCPVRFVGLVKC